MTERPVPNCWYPMDDPEVALAALGARRQRNRRRRLVMVVAATALLIAIALLWR